MDKKTASREAQEITQSEILIEFFQRNPNRDIPHPEAVDWSTKEFKKRTGKVFRDPDRGIRKMHRGQNTIFTQDAATPSWIEYSSPATETWQFVQVKILAI